MKTIPSEADITKLIKNNEWMMDVLRAAEELNLHDWWIGAGFLRNRIWDFIEGKDFTPSRDVDLVYFDLDNLSPEADWALDKKMNSKYPFAQWEIRNQARMHYKNKFSPATSTADGISRWIETATCIAVRIKNDKLDYLFCYGTGDLFNLIARPTPYFKNKDEIRIFYNRLEAKQWRQKWPNLRVITEEL